MSLRGGWREPGGGASARRQPINWRGGAAARAAERAGLAGEFLPVLAMRAHGVAGHHVPALPTEGGPQHPGPTHHTPVIGGIRADAQVRLRHSHATVADLEHEVPVAQIVHDAVPGAAPQHIGHALNTASPPARCHDPDVTTVSYISLW